MSWGHDVGVFDSLEFKGIMAADRRRCGVMRYAVSGQQQQ
jgi:hypothetical protein